jgi:hypothetical protein
MQQLNTIIHLLRNLYQLVTINIFILISYLKSIYFEIEKNFADKVMMILQNDSEVLN